MALDSFNNIQINSHTKKTALNIQEQKKQFSELAFKNDIVEKPSYSFRHLNLSGIYNLAFYNSNGF